MANEFAMVGNLPLPKRLLALIDSGLWPNTNKEALRQNLKSLVPKERIQLFAPEEDRLYLFPPPFNTVRKKQQREAPGKFWSRYCSLDEIVPELSVEIGGFAIGSDSPLLLDYRQDRLNPTVIRLQWRRQQPNTWVRCANSFDEFADILGLDSSR